MLCYTQDDANAEGGMYYAINSFLLENKTKTHFRKETKKILTQKRRMISILLVFSFNFLIYY